MTHIYRIRKFHPERFGQPCRVLARGKLNSCLIEFEDGYKMVTSRWFVRKLMPLTEANAVARQNPESN